jgi:CBS domain-containing protein
MKVRDVMNARPRTVRPHDKLSEAARIMWDHDCGWIPVVDDGGRVLGVVTDRDVCMAAYTRGRPLADIAVEGTMSTNVFSTHGDDPLENALALMRNYRVRRLPVVDDGGRVIGLLSLSDLSRRAAAKDSAVQPIEVIATLAAICEPRSASSAV